MTRAETRWLCRLVLVWAALVGSAAWLRPLLLQALSARAVVAGDGAAAAWLQSVMDPAALVALQVLSVVHGTVPMLLLVAVMAAALARGGDTARLAHLLACVPLGMALNAMVKIAVLRPRPEFPYTVETLATFSFPSGHTAVATLLYGWLLLQAWPRLHGMAARAAAVLATVVMVVLVAASRVALGVHHASDCVAAVAEASLWLAACTLAASPVRPRVAPPS